MELNINLKSVLSLAQKEILEGVLNKQLWSLYMKRKDFVSAVIPYLSLKEVIIAGEEVGLLYGLNGQDVEQLTITTQTLSDDNYGEFQKILVTHHGAKSIARGYLSLFSELKDESVLPIQFAHGLEIADIDVFGIKLEGFKREDEDFIDVIEVLTVDVDTLLKINLKLGGFFVVHAKDGLILLQFYEKEEVFAEYIEMSCKAWGREYGYQYKYKIAPTSYNQ